MTAAGAEAVELKAMSLDGKPVAGCHFLLQLLDFAVFELDDLSAARADEVVVVPFVRDVVVLGLRTEMPGLSEACFAEEVQGAVDRGQSEVWVGLGELMVHGFGGDMFLAEKGAQNEFSLLGEFQLMFGEMLFEHIHFLYVFA